MRPSFPTAIPDPFLMKSDRCCARPTLPRRSSSRHPSFPGLAARGAMYGQEEDWDGLAATQGHTAPRPAPQGRAERAVCSGTRANGQPEQPARPEPVQPQPVPLTPHLAKVRSIWKANPVQKSDLKGLGLAEKLALGHLRNEVLRRKPDEWLGNWHMRRWWRWWCYKRDVATG